MSGEKKGERLHINKDNEEILTEYRFDEAGPQVFRVGDIVEAQLSFIVVPIKGEGLKMHTVLRSLALLSSQFSRVG
jgi:hypothetical protein